MYGIIFCPYLNFMLLRQNRKHYYIKSRDSCWRLLPIRDFFTRVISRGAYNPCRHFITLFLSNTCFLILFCAVQGKVGSITLGLTVVTSLITWFYSIIIRIICNIIFFVYLNSASWNVSPETVASVAIFHVFGSRNFTVLKVKYLIGVLKIWINFILMFKMNKRW